MFSEGLREGLEIKGQPVCEVNSREQYFTYSTFSQRMLMSVHFVDIVLSEGLVAARTVHVFSPCFQLDIKKKSGAATDGYFHYRLSGRLFLPFPLFMNL